MRVKGRCARVHVSAGRRLRLFAIDVMLSCQVYFARISALNTLGYGARRPADPMDAGATDEGGMGVPYQVRRFFETPRTYCSQESSCWENMWRTKNVS